MITAVQRAIDEWRYPPTHSYAVATLAPRGPLVERLATLLELCPTMFEADAFLDVGCSKGFFSLRAARESGYVLALDPDEIALATWAPICPANVEQRVGAFASLGAGAFDMVLILNGHHYAHREDPTGWMDRLERLATDRVVIEGPVDRRCKDVADWPDVIEEPDLLAGMGARGFALTGRANSVTYTPNRAVWCFKTR